MVLNWRKHDDQGLYWNQLRVPIDIDYVLNVNKYPRIISVV